MGKLEISNAAESTPSTDHQKLVTGDFIGNPTPLPNLMQIRSRGGLVGKWVGYIEFLSMTFFANSPTREKLKLSYYRKIQSSLAEQ